MRSPITTLITLVAVGGIGLGTGAQSAVAQCECGTILTPQGAKRALELIAAGAYDPKPGPRAIVYVPLTFHVVRTSAGEGGLPADRICETLDDVDVGLLDTDIQFYLAGPIDYIDDDDFYYNIDTMGEINALRRTNVVPATINCYFTENLAREGGPICGISSFTWSPVQGIVMDNDCTAVWWNHTTFPHEVGHYFDLVHTHETAYGAECVDGSNCDTAGDLLCDTPADPGLGNHNVTGACIYVGDEIDPCHGDPYDPDTTNMMSSSRPSCRTSFTPQQTDKAHATLFNLRPELVHHELPAPFDCNANGVRDDCDIANGTSSDVNANGVPDECECVGDLDGDDDTDQGDLGVLLKDWNCTGGNCAGDLDADGDTDQADLGILLADWGCTP